MPNELANTLESVEALLRPLTPEEAADYLGVSKSHLYRLTSNRKIPHYKPAGGRIYFRREDLKEYLLRNRVPPETES